MYLIITDNEKLVEQAEKIGAAVFNSERASKPDKYPERKGIEHDIIDFMTELAIRPDLKGYDYIKYIMEKCAQDSKYHQSSITKVIYPECASKFNTKPSRVDRAINHALEVGFKEVPERYSNIFGRTLERKPKNSEFISMMSEILTNM